MENCNISPEVIDELEQSKNEVLQRIAAKLKAQKESCDLHAGHNSTTGGHRSGSCHTSHSSTH